MRGSMEAEIIPSSLNVAPKPERIIKKVPGKIPPVPRENDIYLKDLSQKSTVDLKELLERQNKILSNKSLVRKLDDNGKKVSELRDRIERELNSRDGVDKAADLLSSMSLGQLNALEWTGRCNPGYHKNDACNPEAEETDPLQIMASHCGTTAQLKQIQILEPEESLIKAEDLVCPEDRDSSKDICGSDANKSPSASSAIMSDVQNASEKAYSCLSSNQKFSSVDAPEPFAHFICERYGHKESKERFKPNKPIKPFTGVFPFKPPGRVSLKPKCWEETNVTPPTLVHTDTKLLSLEESLEIQSEQNRKLKEVQILHAASKLSSLHGIRMVEHVPPSVVNSMAYRSQIDSDSEHELNEADLEDQEHYDEDQQDLCSTVVYNVDT